MGQQWTAAESGTLNTTVPTQVLLKEVTKTVIAPTTVWPQVTNNREGTQPRPSTDNWIKDLLSSASHNKQDLPPQSVSPNRKLPQASYPYLSQGRQNEHHNHEKITKLITWSTALSNSTKL